MVELMEKALSNYSMLNEWGNPTHLNTVDDWSGDLTKLDTGYYAGYIQNTKIQDEYPLTQDIPDEVSGHVCLITIIDLGYENRKYYEIRTTRTNNVFTRTTAENEKTAWTRQQKHRLTWDDGTAMHWRWGYENPDAYPTDNLYIPITELKSGFYIGAIHYLNEGDDLTTPDPRNLPPTMPMGQTYTALITQSGSGRKHIVLSSHYAHVSYIGTTGVDGSDLVWRRIDDYEDYLGKAKANFSLKMNKKGTESFNLLAITDTHWQLDGRTTQVSFVNPNHLKNFNDLDRQIYTNDVSVHLGDWTDGNYERDTHIYSVVEMGSKFFDKPNRYGVIGNHDYNPQWDGNAGNHAYREGSLDYHVYKDELAPYMTKEKKPYHFTDLESKKIRMIFLNCFDISEYVNPDNNKLYQNPQGDYGFGKEQVNWFINTLKTVPEGYDVVIFTHDVFDNVYENLTYKNGDAMREIAEAYQNKTIGNKVTSDIGSSNPEFDYYNLGMCQQCVDMTDTHGKILGVFAGHRHKDMSIFKNGIRYVSLLCSRPSGGTTTQVPPRSYFTNSEEAITFIEVDKKNKRIVCNRFGAGNNYTYKMFSN